MTLFIDPSLAQAVGQTEAAWAAVREARLAIYWSAAGVIVNFLLAVAAVTIPAWQRRMMKRDAAEVAAQTKRRFVNAFQAVAEAQEAVGLATLLHNPDATPAFAKAEIPLRGSVQALTQAGAATIPVSVAIYASIAQYNSTVILSHYPDLVNYGPNLLTYGSLGEQLRILAAETRALLTLVEESPAWEVG